MQKKKTAGKFRKESKRLLTQSIINVFGLNPKKPLNHKQLSRHLGLKKANEKKWAIEILFKLTKEERLTEVAPGKYKLVQNIGGTSIGKMMRDRGTAWFLPDDGGDEIMIPEHYINRALNGDRIRVLLHAKRNNRPSEGEVTEVIERSNERFVGVVPSLHQNHEN